MSMVLAPAQRTSPAPRAELKAVTPLARIWIDDPHAVVRRGMIASLAAEFAVVGESQRLKPTPDLTHTDILIFDADGAGAGAALRLAVGRPTRLIAVVRRPDDTRLHELVAAGVGAVIFHDDLTPDLLVDTVRAVGRDRTSLPAGTLPRLLERAARVATSSPGALTQRERDVLKMLAEGQDTRAIAVGLSYSERTVKNVVHDVLTKLNCRTRAQAVGLATRAGMI
jgi:DNA-binding NarL/FixJ family response regulator